MYIKKFSSRSLGSKGEIIIQSILQKKGFQIIETNVQIGKIGEIDIIALKDNVYRFIEVKTIVSHDEKVGIELPFYNISMKKLKTLDRLSALWMAKRNLSELYQIDAAGVVFVPATKTWKYKILENISK
jgi:putative endonuclease